MHENAISAGHGSDEDKTGFVQAMHACSLDQEVS